MVKMLKIYRTRYTLRMEKERDEKWVFWTDPFILEESDAEMNRFAKQSGDTFESFWEVYKRYGLMLPCNTWMRGIFSKKRRIEFFFDYAPTWVDNGEKRKWTIEEELIEIQLSMEQLMKIKPADKVIEYLKERGIEKIF